MVLVGWGGGAENSLRDAIAHPNNTKALVVMDTSPDGIEWMDARRIHNWSYAQMIDFRADDLKGRVSIAETVLALGIPWYVLFSVECELVCLMNIGVSCLSLFLPIQQGSPTVMILSVSALRP